MVGPWLSPDRGSGGSLLYWSFQEDLFTFSLLPLQDMAVGTKDSPEDSSSSTPASRSQLTQAGAREVSAGWSCPIIPGSLSITSGVGSWSHGSSCSCARMVFGRKDVFSVCSQPCNRVLQTGTQDSGKEEHGCTPAACGQSSGARERAQSRPPQWGKDLRSWVGDTTDYEPSRGRRRTSSQHRDHTARDKAAPRPSNSSSESGPAPSAALEQTLSGQGDQSRSLCQGHGLHSRFMKRIDSHHSARRIRRRRARRPHRDRAPRDDAAAGPSNVRCRQAATHRAAQEQTLLRQRERSRSPRRGYNLRRRFVDIMDRDPSAGRRRRRRMASVPRRSKPD